MEINGCPGFIGKSKMGLLLWYLIYWTYNCNVPVFFFYVILYCLLSNKKCIQKIVERAFKVKYTGFVVREIQVKFAHWCGSFTCFGGHFMPFLNNWQWGDDRKWGDREIGNNMQQSFPSRHKPVTLQFMVSAFTPRPPWHPMLWILKLGGSP